MEFLHPSISSRIIDNSIVFVSAQGTTKLFCAFTSDQGEDNVVKYISSPTELLFNYGEPNFRKHGQAMYNMDKWTKSGGGIYCLRALPTDAGYAHAIVNIQTKTGTKTVGSTGGVPNVDVRTTCYYNSVNNTSVSALEGLLDSETAGTTIDGFTNHLLLGVYPKGRGEAYNDLGFKLQLSDKFDNTYAFRVYSFESFKVTSTGAVEGIESPMFVSFDPDAIGTDGQSMFIKNVVEKYSLYFNIIFNEEAYDALGTVFNPDVNPQVLDFLNGISRSINGEAETYSNALTGTSLDVHVAVQKYSGGAAVMLGDYNVTNFADADDLLEYAMVERDDAARTAIYNTKVNTVTYMRYALADANLITTTGTAAATAFKARIASTNNLMTDYASSSPYAPTSAAGTLSTPYTAFLAATTGTSALYVTAKSAGNVPALKTACDNVITALTTIVNGSSTVLDYATAVSGISTTATLYTKLGTLLNSISHLQGYDLQVAGKKLLADAAALAVEEASTSSESVQIAAIESAINTIQDIRDYANSLSTVGASGDATDAKIVTLLANYAIVIDDNQVEGHSAALAALLTSGSTGISSAVTTLNLYLDKALTEKIISVLDLYIPAGSIAINTVIVQPIMLAFETARASIANASTSNTTKSAIIAAVTNNIIDAQLAVTAALANTYNLRLQNFDNFIPFLTGTDGSIAEGVAGRTTTINNLLISAYQGTLAPEMTNKRETPYDLVLDANYSTNVKNAIVTLCTAIRDDIFGIVDTGITANPQQAIDFRRGSMTVNDYRIAIYTQNLSVYDEYTGKVIPVTSTNFLAGKIPQNDVQFGIHFPLAGPRRGTISGFEDKSLSWNPNETAQEELYKKQINYIIQDSRKTMFNSQSTSQIVISALSNVSVVRALLRIKRDVETLAEDYQFEFNDSITLDAFQTNLNGNLAQWVTNRACESITGTVYSSAYDKQQKIARVRVDMIFTSIIERIMIDLVVGK